MLSVRSVHTAACYTKRASFHTNNAMRPARSARTKEVLELVDNSAFSYKISIHAEVAELADALRSGRSEHSARESSNLSFGTKDLPRRRSFLLNHPPK